MKAGSAYYVEDCTPRVRLIVLDTVNTAGDYQGSIGARQAAWLEEQLAEVHSRHLDRQGRWVHTTQEDRLVVIVSHHGLSTLINNRAHSHREADYPRLLATEVEAILHRFPNVILWVNGHTHRNLINPRADETEKTGGFWEITTSSLIDWPCQARLVELVSNGDGTLSIVSTMVDHAAPANPEDADGLFRLAAMHRELASNDPHLGLRHLKEGSVLDRNVELIIPAPFELQ